MKTGTVFSNVDGEREGMGGKDIGICALRLAKSIRRNGGRCKDIDIVFWHPSNNRPEERLLKQLRDLNCKIIEGELINNDPMLSKQSAFQSEEFNTDYTVYLDTDSYVLGDFTDMFQVDTDLSLMPAQWSYETYAKEDDLPKIDEFYRAYGFKRTDLRGVSQVDNKECNFYFYSTAMVYKNGIEFGKKYKEAFMAVLGAIDGTPLPHVAIAVCQASIGMFVQKNNLSYGTIPLSMYLNFASFNHTIVGSPAIVHYQWQRFPGAEDDIWESKWK